MTVILMWKDYTLFIRVTVHCMAFSSVTGCLVLTELIAHQKQYRKGNACQNWDIYLQMQCCHIEAKVPPRPDPALLMASEFF